MKKANIRKIKKSLNMKIKYHDPDLIHAEKHSHGDWIDLRAAETVHIEKGAFYPISLGISVQLPPGYEMILEQRSSLTKKWGLIKATSGIIDESFCGDNDIITFGVVAIRDTIVNKNERICQFRLQKHMPALDIEEVETLGNPDRGGEGSTGLI